MAERWNGRQDILVKRDYVGDYVDYNDYDARAEQLWPNSLLKLPHDDVSITDGYLDATTSVYDSGLSDLNAVLSSAGLADFRTGVRTGDWIDPSPTDGLREGYWEDIGSQKVDEDMEKADDSA